MVTEWVQLDRHCCSIEFTAHDLEPDTITKLLNREPDRSFRRGDRLGTEYSRSQGAWMVSSAPDLVSNDVTDHLAWATTFLTENSTEILEAKRACGCTVRLRIFWEFDATMSFVFTHEMLKRFSSSLDDISFSIV